MTFPTRAQIDEHRRRSILALTAVEGIIDGLPPSIAVSALAQALGTVIGDVENAEEAAQLERDAVQIIENLTFSGSMRAMKREVQRQAEQRLKAHLPRTEDELIPPALLGQERPTDQGREEAFKEARKTVDRWSKD